MPLYEYQCDACGRRFEVIQKFSDPPVAACEVCGGPVHKLLSSPAIQFKGSGWYITDYARAGKKDGAPSSGSEPAKKTEGGDSKTAAASETKSEPKPPAPATST